MMINKENEVIKNEKDQPQITDVVDLDIQCHILVKDVDTGEIIINQRG